MKMNKAGLHNAIRKPSQVSSLDRKAIDRERFTKLNGDNFGDRILPANAAFPD